MPAVLSRVMPSARLWCLTTEGCAHPRWRSITAGVPTSWFGARRPYPSVRPGVLSRPHKIFCKLGKQYGGHLAAHALLIEDPELVIARSMSLSSTSSTRLPTRHRVMRRHAQGAVDNLQPQQL